MTGLLREADLPTAVNVSQLTGRGFENEISLARLDDGQQVVLRRWSEPRQPERLRAEFLEAHGVPAPRLLAANRHASLYPFVSGELLGDLIETGCCSQSQWRMVGAAFRRVHDIAFPALVKGDLEPDRLFLRPVDPVAQMHGWIDESAPGLRRLAPDSLQHLPALHEIVDKAAESLRTAGTSLLHGDISMWNIIVGDGDVSLIDWDYPCVGDPAMEVALIDKHASLFNGYGLDEAFFDGYGQGRAEPNTSLHRVVQTMRWAASSDWRSFDELHLPADVHRRTKDWLSVLLVHVGQLPAHIERLRTLL